MLPGSVYYHFASKDALLAAVYSEAIDRSIGQVEEAIAIHQNDPWDRLEAAAIAHLSLLLTDGTSWPPWWWTAAKQPSAARDELVRQRDRYEAVFRRVIAELDLPPGASNRDHSATLCWVRSTGRSPGTDRTATRQTSSPATSSPSSAPAIQTQRNPPGAPKPQP